ncbi:MAG: PTS transporter subunit EIIC [Treponema sp.]|nr:PTS transporter subunit EIIC [Treponema sp.]
MLAVMSAVGNAVFSNLPLIFALAVALGMAKNEKAVAVLASGVAFIVMHVTISSILIMLGKVTPDGIPAATVLSGSVSKVLGITSLEMGVFGGIICGLMVAALHNRFCKIELPTAVSYFAGVRFVPIICTVGAMVLGAAMSILWPVIQTGISFIGGVVLKSGHFGTFIFGFAERALILFGLHHVFYIPFWQTGLGGSAIVDGIERFGSQGIYFAELASKNVEFFNLSATRFLTGKYPFMMAGLPASALAMYHCAKPEKRKIVGGLLMSAALTSFLTGITEPIEFTFLFITPFLFIVHCGFAGLAFVLTNVLKIAIGTTFSDGLIDFTLYGILQGNAKTNWLLMLPVFAGYFVLYYFFFKFAILKWNLKTPGREEEGEEPKLYTRKDYGTRNTKKKSKSAETPNDTLSPLILRGLGGKQNIRSVDACATRLRLEVGNPDLVQDDLLKQSGAKGVLKKGNGIQVVYGPHVTIIKSNFEEYLAEAEDAPLAGKLILASPLTGKIVPFSEVKDEAFSTGAMGLSCTRRAADHCGKKIKIIPCRVRRHGVLEEFAVIKMIAVDLDGTLLLDDHGAALRSAPYRITARFYHTIAPALFRLYVEFP